MSAAVAQGLDVRRLVGAPPPPDGFLRCSECGELAARRRKDQVTCGAPKCQRRRCYRAERRRPEYREANRRRCAAWYERHKAEHVARVVERARRQTEPHWFISDHAVQQWRARYGKRGDTMAEAREQLVAELARAHHVKTDDVGELWRSGRPRKARFVVVRHATTLDLVTVLPPFDGWRR